MHLPAIAYVSLSNLDNLLADWALRLLFAILILVAGQLLARFAGRVLDRVLGSRKVDPSLIRFAGSLLYFGIMAVAGIAALGKIGIPVGSLVALLAAAGLAIGLALQGTLSHLAAGVMILLFRPFRAGDVIDGAGVMGTVKGTDLMTTELESFDGKKILVPNGRFIEGVITNINAYASRRVDLEVSVSYADDVERARAVILGLFEGDERILGDPAPSLVITGFGDSGVNLVARPWVAPDQWWTVLTEYREKVKTAFAENGIQIPFPQREIRMLPPAGESADTPAAS